MFYSEEIIDEVREKNDIVDVISPYVRLTKQLCGIMSVSQRKNAFIFGEYGKTVFSLFWLWCGW